MHGAIPSLSKTSSLRGAGYISTGATTFINGVESSSSAVRDFLGKDSYCSPLDYAVGCQRVGGTHYVHLQGWHFNPKNGDSVFRNVHFISETLYYSWSLLHVRSRRVMRTNGWHHIPEMLERKHYEVGACVQLPLVKSSFKSPQVNVMSDTDRGIKWVIDTPEQRGPGSA
jgi:hypothetical protein